jgi:hypothetical protein
MPNPVQRLLAALLAMLSALTLAAPVAFAGSPTSFAAASGCDSCCLAAGGGCASVCAPQAPAAQGDEQAPGKPAGAWSVGVVPSVAPVVRHASPVAAASDAFSLPAYLVFQRLLL